MVLASLSNTKNLSLSKGINLIEPLKIPLIPRN